MYLARFSYDVLPKNRHSAIDFIRREVEAARGIEKEVAFNVLDSV